MSSAISTGSVRVPMHDALNARRAGVLLHPTSLPGPGGGGDLGPEAFRFVDLLAECGFGVWQVLPLGPVHSDRSPYRCQSAHAGSTKLISIDDLVERGWLASTELRRGARGRGGQASRREELLARARRGFETDALPRDQAAFASFVDAQRDWLEPYAMYRVIKSLHRGAPWWRWRKPLRDNDPKATGEVARCHAQALAQVRFEQFLFAQQWHALKRHANDKGVALFGDIPLFVAHDSVDVWVQRDCFRLDERGQPTHVAGVPPDAFSATGQRWGNPLYDWNRMIADDFAWWKRRLTHQTELFDLLRIDHFRGLEACWEIPASEPTAARGRWIHSPGDQLFESLRRTLGHLPLVAEDLGLITPAVHALRNRFNIPGMTVVQFAFDSGSDNPHLPANHAEYSVAYTGTHDNNTIAGWYSDVSPAGQHHICEVLGAHAADMPWAIVSATFASRARLAMVPMQDLLDLGSEGRMNVPGVASGNWRWQFSWRRVTDDRIARVKQLMEDTGRRSGPALTC